MQFNTAEEYVMYRVRLQDKHKYEYMTPKEELVPLIDVLRSLPHNEASNLLNIHGYVRDGDYGYGDWWNGYQYWLDFKDNN